MNFRVTITSRAEAELYEAAVWWAENRSPDQALRWLEGYERAIASLADAPEKHSLAREDRDFPYTLHQLLYIFLGHPDKQHILRYCRQRQGYQQQYD